MGEENKRKKEILIVGVCMENTNLAIMEAMLRRQCPPLLVDINFFPENKNLEDNHQMALTAEAEKFTGFPLANLCENLEIKLNVSLEKLHNDFPKYFKCKDKPTFKELLNQKQKIPRPRSMPKPRKVYVERHY